MIVKHVPSRDRRRIETLMLTGVESDDHEFLTALYRFWAEGGAVEITLEDGKHVKLSRQGVLGRRRSPRIAIRIPVTLLWEENEVTHEEHTFTLTVSWFGCAVCSHRCLPPGTRVRLKRDAMVIEARVVHNLQDQSTKLVEVGLAFDQDGRAFWGIVVWGS